MGSELAWDALLSSLPELPPVPATTSRVDARRYADYVGRYVLGPGAVLSVTREGDRLLAEAAGEQSVYGFARGRRVELLPTASAAEFVADNATRDRVRFQTGGAGSAGGLVLNPGPWALPAQKKR